MKINRARHFFFVLIILFSFNSSYTAEGAKQNAQPKFEDLGKGAYIVRYSNVIKNINGKNLKIPIFEGIYEDIFYNDLQKKQKDKRYNLLNGLKIVTQKGRTKETFYKLLNFYENNLLKDVDIHKPSLVAAEGIVWTIWYDFKLEGISSSMQIIAKMDYLQTNKKLQKLGLSLDTIKDDELKIDMLEFDENSDWIGLKIIIGESSGF